MVGGAEASGSSCHVEKGRARLSFLLHLLPQDGSLLSSPFLKGFLAGYVVAKLRASAVLGFAVGTCTGIYAAQTYAVPNVEKTVRDYLRSLRKGPN